MPRIGWLAIFLFALPWARVAAPWLSAVTLAPPAYALAPPDLQLPAPAPVVDEYGLLSADEVSRLDALVRKIKAKSGVELTIYIASSLRDLPIEDFSIAVAEGWKLGRKKEDKGLLMIVAPRERKMRIEVGYGLEGDLTDAFTRRVLDNGMRPLFKQGRYYDGILSSVLLIQEKVPLGLGPEDAPQEEVASGKTHGSVGSLLWILFFVLLYAISWIGRLRGNSYRGGGWGGGGFGGGLGGGSWGGGSSGGSSWGGGGGGFGGGGSSSSW